MRVAFFHVASPLKFSQMTTEYQFVWPATTPLTTPTHTLFVCEGPDWCLEELRNAAGTVVRSWSYEIVNVESDEQGLVREVLLRGHDWVGSCLLRTLQVPCSIRKEDEKGVWLHLGAWERVQWPSAEKDAAMAWRTAAAAVTPAVPIHILGPAPSAKTTKRVSEMGGRGGGGAGRGTGRGTGRGRGQGDRGTTKWGGTPHSSYKSPGIRRENVHGTEAAICRIRIPGTH